MPSSSGWATWTGGHGGLAPPVLRLVWPGRPGAPPPPQVAADPDQDGQGPGQGPVDQHPGNYLVPIAPGGYLGRSTLEAAVETLRRSFPDGRPFAATEAKEALGTTRRTAIPLLEHLDHTGVTILQGDLRRLA